MADEEVIPRKRPKFSAHIVNLLNDILEDKEALDSSFNGIDSEDGCDECGKILSIKLKNFMCHDNLEFDFADKINFISGKNGSGKSAILTGLVVGLGGRTSDTNRGQSIKNLIKHGKNQASIEITLRNTGPRQFKPHTYGKSIKIVRTISGSSSQYKTIAENGTVVSTKRIDIDVINMFLNIQVSNPVVILNQDTARTFMKSSAPKDLYSIFMKGTHLEEIEFRLHALSQEKIPKLDQLIQEKTSVLEEANKDLRVYEEKLEKIKDLEKQEKKASKLLSELSWARVLSVESELGVQKAEELEIEKRLPQIKDKISKRSQVEEELKNQILLSSKLLKEKKAKSHEIDNEALEHERSLRNLKEQLTTKMNEVKQVKKKIDCDKKSCIEIQSEIDNHESQSAELISKKTKHQSQMQELEKRLEELKAVRQTTFVHKEQLNDTYNAVSTEFAQKKQLYLNLQRKIAYKEETLQGLKVEKNQLMVYSKWMPDIVNRVEMAFHQKKLKKKCIGPLGSFIRVNDKKWGPAIENFIGAKTLSSFCVDNSNDYKVLKSIFDSLNVPISHRPSVIISKFIDKVHDVSRNETKSGELTSLFRSISISNPVVANALIDSMEPENVLLIPTSNEAYNICEQVENVPRHCKKAFTLQGDLFYPAPNYRSYAGNVDENASTRYLQVSREQAIKAAEQEIFSSKKELQKIEYNIEGMKSSIAEATKNLDEVNVKVVTYNKQITACENKLEEFKQEEFPEIYDVHLLREDLEFRQKNVETAENALKVLENDNNSLVTQFKEAKEKLENTKAAKSQVLEKIEKIENDIAECHKECEKLNSRSDNYQSLLKKEESRLKSIKEKISDLEKDLENLEKLAKDIHPERIDQTREISILESSLQKIQSMVKALKKVIGDINSVPDEYQSRVEQLKEKEEILQSLVDVSSKLKNCVDAFSNTYQREKVRVFKDTRKSFIKMLEAKKLSGDLIINHEKKTLQVVVKVQSSANDKSSTLTLSGGERSYSMVSFILALWNNMSTPFFFLDEFDVFMDEINRNMVMGMLLDHAKSKPEQQFVFLTPHANLNNELLRGVQFFRMPDPRA